MLERLLITFLTVATTASVPEVHLEEPEKQEELTVEIPPQNPPQLALRMGTAYIDGRQYELLAPSFTVSGLSIEVRYHKQNFESVNDGKLRLKNVDVLGTKTNILVKGKAHSLEHQLGFNFGWDLPKPRLEKKYIRIIPSVHLNGGLQIEVTRLEMGEEIPKDIDLRFFVGVGGRTRIVYPISHLTRLPVLRGLEAGIGFGAEYRRSDVRDIGSGRDRGNSYAVEGYGLLVYVPDKSEPTVITVEKNGEK